MHVGNNIKRRVHVTQFGESITLFWTACATPALGDSEQGELSLAHVDEHMVHQDAHAVAEHQEGVITGLRLKTGTGSVGGVFTPVALDDVG